VTLNDLERRNAILRYFTEFGSFRGALHSLKVVEDVVVKKLTFAISSPDEFLVKLSYLRNEAVYFVYFVETCTVCVK